MLGEKGTIVVKAITGADALVDGAFSDFEASAILMEDATGGATGTVNAKKFKVINTLSVPVHIDDELVATKTIQGFYVTVSHNPCRAKWIKFAYSSLGTVTVDAFYDGSDPAECGTITVIYPLGEPCDGDTVIAFYNPNEDQYVAIATESAMMGTPVNKNLPTTVDPSSCGIAVTKEQFRVFPSLCEPATPNQEFLSLGETVPVLVSISAGDCGEIAYAHQNIKAFACDSEGAPTSPSFSDFTLNLGTAKFITDISFNACTLEFLSKTIAESCAISGVPGTVTAVPIPTVEMPVVQEVYMGTDAIIIERATARVCSFVIEPEDQIPLTDCPTTPTGCTGNAVFTWDVDLQEWYQTTACGAGCATATAPADPPADPFSPTTADVPCVSS